MATTYRRTSQQMHMALRSIVQVGSSIGKNTISGVNQQAKSFRQSRHLKEFSQILLYRLPTSLNGAHKENRLTIRMELLSLKLVLPKRSITLLVLGYLRIRTSKGRSVLRQRPPIIWFKPVAYSIKHPQVLLA